MSLSSIAFFDKKNLETSTCNINLSYARKNNLAEDLDICLRPKPMFTSAHNSKELWMILLIYFADSQLQKMFFTTMSAIPIQHSNFKNL